MGIKVSYKRELDHNYLILEQEVFQDNYQVGMLVKNKIPGLLECSLNRIDKKADIYYEITSRGKGLLQEKAEEWKTYETAVNQVMGGVLFGGL